MRIAFAAGFATALAAGVACAASPPPVGAEHGMVVSAQQHATRVGVDVLRRGGNAVDAAVAVGYALAVVYPAAGNLGGGGFMTLQLASGTKTFVDFRERAPLAANADMYLDAAGQPVRGASTRGYGAAAVPGTVAGLEHAREKYGTRSRAELIAPAIRLAREGFELEQGDSEMIGIAAGALARDPASAAIFVDAGRAPAAGTRLVQADLARSLEAIAIDGPAAFYRGPLARAMVEASRAGGGRFAAADFEQYAVRERAPIECDYRGYHVVSAPPPSSGGVVLCLMLQVLEGYSLKDWGFRSAQAVHHQIEAMRHAYADRNHWLGDPDFVDNPVARLLDPAYAARLREAISPQRAGVSREIRPGVPPHEGSHTTHYSIVDAAGNAVSVTYTLNGWFGAAVTVPGTGIVLNNEMDDFTVKRGVPNFYGLVQGDANAIAPGKRPLSSMSPTIITRDGKPLMVVGTPGGSRIITAVLHTILNVIDYGMTIQEAVDAPRFHQQWLPEATALEPFALSPDTRRLLEAMGHVFTEQRPANHVAAILVGAPSLGGRPRGKARVYGANDPRYGTGLALGH